MTATTPLHTDQEQLADLLEATKRYAEQFLSTLNERAVGAQIREPIHQPDFPLRGIGGMATMQWFKAHYDALLSASAGPRYLGFVTGGTTPAALMADWLVSTFDQNAQWSGETIAPFLEQQALNWLRDMLGLPDTFTGICVTGATMANFTGLAIGRQWLGEQHGIDIAEQGLQAMRPIRVLSGSAHSSILKALAMLGIGHQQLEKLPCVGDSESVDISALRERLQQLDGEPVMVVGNAGVVNNGDFDDLKAIASLKNQWPFWLHIDGAFGLLAGLSPRYQHLIAGTEAADSITVDGHKWLNVPYDAGYLYTRHLASQLKVFQNVSPYLGAPVANPLNTLHLGPENSRRWRALPLWFSLMAYGKQGLQHIIENDIEMAQQFAAMIDELEPYRMVVRPKLNIACFSLRESAEMNALKALQQRLYQQGELFVTPSSFRGTPVLRAAFSNWRTDHVDLARIKSALLAAQLTKPEQR
ncbi:pyridoxal phosphate-dependent decarboxylase family protein [Permianibacter aggregans]|uniref:Glutamate/tyrosine decarboxylase-like PLP-dependent enzyme n=1 Tax=Permianibacter aggregans TaxID=1510150 RepID=A0A4R6UWU4_9GAMM|nr:pyridoxal-dependent decarboxylase [Permianibacter aggregans]TDQ48054.1 glutamate/tyrosine decarboxylase-like PLP-dependent enzyme [Permianibacter aggregans]